MNSNNDNTNGLVFPNSDNPNGNQTYDSNNRTGSNIPANQGVQRGNSSLTYPNANPAQVPIDPTKVPPTNRPTQMPQVRYPFQAQQGVSYPNQQLYQAPQVQTNVTPAYPNSARRNANQGMVSSDTKMITNVRESMNNNEFDRNEENTSKAEDDLNAKRKKKIKKILIWAGCAVLGLIIGVTGFLLWYKSYLLGKINYVDTRSSIVDEDGNVVNIADLADDADLIDDEAVSNFLLIGIDSRQKSYTDDGTGALADVIMIMSVNNEEGTIKLVSIARDSYVYVPGYSSPCKINAAMNYGGPELLMVTIQNNFRISLEGYAYVNFYNMANVVDAVGGVYVDATSSEVYGEGGLNTNLAEINMIEGYFPDYQQVSNSGTIWLNGRQAVAYARIRHIGNGDYERSTRQVEVLRSIMSQFMNMSLSSKASTIDDILSMVATNVSSNDITSYALNFLPSISNLEIQYLQLPFEGFYNSGIYGQEWSIRGNWNMMIPYVQEFLYGHTEDFEEVVLPPNAPDDRDCPDEYDIEEHLQ